MRIDIPRLLLQWGAVWFMVTGLLVTWKKRALPEEPSAIQRLRQAAEQGDANAQVRLGIMYQYGWDLPQDNTEAAQWVRRAAKQGDANAQVRLAQAYSLGEGLPLDFAEAFQWYRRAANQGDIGSQYAIGLMCFAGLGVPWEVVEAYFWLYVAIANSSHGEGYNPAAIDALDTVARQMTPAQIARARERASQWQPRKEK